MLIATLGALLLMLVAPAGAQVASTAPHLTAADSALVGRILLAEDRRDSLDAALAEGAAHADARVRRLAVRALGRIRDDRFAARTSLTPLPPPVLWPETPAQRRWRALAEVSTDCAALRAALRDRDWDVRLRAVDFAGVPARRRAQGAQGPASNAPPPCANDSELRRTLRAWIDALPRDASWRRMGFVSWHAAAHALVALAHLAPDEARPRVASLAGHAQWQVREYAARAAAVIGDTARLRALARDTNDNVMQTAIIGLSGLTGHADDDIYLEALAADGAQAVRAAATALQGSPRADVPLAAMRTFERFVGRANASERDARLALLAAAGRPASADRPPPAVHELPPHAVALALGDTIRLQVTMASSSGGGSFIVRLRGDVAPMTAARVLALVNKGYYNRLDWQRVEPDFVIQGGSPGSNEYVGAAQFFRDELGTVPHARGTVGMSTRGHDTGDGQWFVNLRDNLRLGRDYTVFAEVVERIETVDGVMEGDVIESIVRVR